jgi:sterol desaturase/sphingolipid hydroxylase (fatty acid hydroxylase superfamily)
MNHLPIDKSRDAEPIRLFKSGFLEFFTHISPLSILVFWTPVVALLLFLAGQGLSLGAILAAFVAGLFLWTFVEYTLHRFLFHYEPRTERMQRVFFLFHGVHHAQPQVKTRLVMPFPISIPGALLFYGLLYGLLGAWLNVPQWVNPLMAGFMVGYLAYDLIHYATHHFTMRSGPAKFLKRYHMAHHFKSPRTRYGVSSPLWDYVFRTSQ